MMRGVGRVEVEFVLGNAWKEEMRKNITSIASVYASFSLFTLLTNNLYISESLEFAGKKTESLQLSVQFQLGYYVNWLYQMNGKYWNQCGFGLITNQLRWRWSCFLGGLGPLSCLRNHILSLLLFQCVFLKKSKNEYGIDQITLFWDNCWVKSGGKGKESFDSFVMFLSGAMMPSEANQCILISQRLLALQSLFPDIVFFPFFPLPNWRDLYLTRLEGKLYFSG